MDKIINKLGSYDILNNLIPGAVFSYLLLFVTDYNLLQNSIGESLVVFYIMGMVLSRFGSVVIEPILKKCKVIKYAEHSDYISASIKYNKLETIMAVNNMFRTIVASVVAVILTKVYSLLGYRVPFLPTVTPFIIVVVILLLFIFSYRKQTSYIVKSIEYVNEEKSKEEKE